uniref:Uncharacterized protein n=1 Tax=Anguilla anguilla TaxID=7936 RepID=A0A0E9V3E6_ANGAN
MEIIQLNQVTIYNGPILVFCLSDKHSYKQILIL